MDVQFRTTDLRREALDERVARSANGKAVGRKYFKAVRFLEACATVQEIREARAWRFHALAGSLKGYYSIDLNKEKGIRLRMSLPGGLGGTRLCVEMVDKTHHKKGS